MMRTFYIIFLVALIACYSCAPRDCCNCKKKHKSSYYNKRNGFDRTATHNNSGTVAIPANPNNPNPNSGNVNNNSGSDYVYKPGKKQMRNSTLNNSFKLKTNQNKWEYFQYYDNIFLSGVNVKLAEGTLNSTAYNELQCLADVMNAERNCNIVIAVYVIDTADVHGNEAIASEIGNRIKLFLESQLVDSQRISPQSGILSPQQVKDKFYLPDMIFGEVIKNKVLVYVTMLPGQ